jgi:hypothetical protein
MLLLATAAFGVPVAQAVSGGNARHETARAGDMGTATQRPFFPIPNTPNNCRCAKTLPPFVGKIKLRLID